MDIKNITNYVIRTDTIDSYLHEIKAIKPMTAQEEKELFSQHEDVVKEAQFCKDVIASFKLSKEKKDEYVQRLTKAENKQIEIRNEIISRNLRFNFAVAKRYNNSDLLPDLINVGMIGMYEAFQQYDYKEGVRFCSFAIWHIRRAINAYLLKENLIVRQKNGGKFGSKVKKIVNNFYLVNGRNPNEIEVMDILEKEYGLEVKDMSDIYGIRVDYLDSYVGEDEENNVEKSARFNEKTSVVNDFESDSNDDALSFAMQKAMKCLTDRETKIVKMASGYGYDKEYKDKEIAEVIGLTSERVRQLRHQAIEKMKYAYASAIAE